ncbi:hypothetical protein ABZP36_034925 [Zizania latifolia]
MADGRPVNARGESGDGLAAVRQRLSTVQGRMLRLVEPTDDSPHTMAEHDLMDDGNRRRCGQRGVRGRRVQSNRGGFWLALKGEKMGAIVEEGTYFVQDSDEGGVNEFLFVSESDNESSIDSQHFSERRRSVGGEQQSEDDLFVHSKQQPEGALLQPSSGDEDMDGFAITCNSMLKFLLPIYYMSKPCK